MRPVSSVSSGAVCKINVGTKTCAFVKYLFVCSQACCVLELFAPKQHVLKPDRMLTTSETQEVNRIARKKCSNNGKGNLRQVNVVDWDYSSDLTALRVLQYIHSARATLWGGQLGAKQ